MQLYDQVYIYINGQLLAENTSISTNLEGEQQEVMTTVKGFAGISAGPDKRVISLENVVPVKGMEFKIEEAYLNKAELEIRLQFGGSGKQCNTKGFVRPGVKIDAGVGKTTTNAYELVCEPSKFE